MCIQTSRVIQLRNGQMVIIRRALAFIRIEKRFKKILGNRDL